MKELKRQIPPSERPRTLIHFVLQVATFAQLTGELMLADMKELQSAPTTVRPPPRPSETEPPKPSSSEATVPATPSYGFSVMRVASRPIDFSRVFQGPEKRHRQSLRRVSDE